MPLQSQPQTLLAHSSDTDAVIAVRKSDGKLIACHDGGEEFALEPAALTTYKEAARLATAAALPGFTVTGSVLTATANGALTVDGTAVALGDRILVLNDGAHNGVYTVNRVGSGSDTWQLVRSADLNSASDFTTGLIVTVREGSVNGGLFYVYVTTGAITLGSTSLTFLPQDVRAIAINVSELRNTLGVENEIRYLRGYTSTNDGAAGFFIWSNTSAIDDGGTIFNQAGLGSNTGGWRRVYSGALDVKWFGAKGDDVTDDTAAIQRAIDATLATQALTETRPKLLTAPGGTYRVTSTLVIAKHVEGQPGLEGEYTFVSFAFRGLAPSVSAVGRAVRINANFNNGPLFAVQAGYAVEFENLTIFGQNTWTATSGKSAQRFATYADFNDAYFVVNSCRDNRYSPYAAIAVDPFHAKAGGKAADIVWQVDASGPTFVDETADFNSATANDFDPFVPVATPQVAGDYVAFGSTTTFKRIVFDYYSGTLGLTGVVVWEYWNGSAWTALSGINDQTNSFKTAVPSAFHSLYVDWTIPGDWTQNTLNGNTKYYVRARITTPYTQNPRIHSGVIVDSANWYPGLHAYYTNTSIGGSTAVHFKRIDLAQFTVGMVISPNGYTANAEAFTWEDCNISLCKTCVAICQDQSRAMAFYNCFMGASKFCINCVEYGERNGANPQIYGGAYGGGWVLALAGGGSPLLWQGGYVESCYSLGYIAGSFQNPNKIDDVQISLMRTASGYRDAVRLWVNAPLTLSNIVFAQQSTDEAARADVDQAPLLIWADSSHPLVLDQVNTEIVGATPDAAQRLGIIALNHYNVRIRACHEDTNAQNEAFFDAVVMRDVNSNFDGIMSLPGAEIRSMLPSDSGAIRKFDARLRYYEKGATSVTVNANGTGSFTGSTLDRDFTIGDFLYSGEPYTPPGCPAALAQSFTTIAGYIGKVTNVAPGQVDFVAAEHVDAGTVSHYLIVPWKPRHFQQVTADYDFGGGTPGEIYNVSSDNRLKVGMRILDKAGRIPANTIVKTVDLALNKATLSKNPTGGAGVENLKIYADPVWEMVRAATYGEDQAPGTSGDFFVRQSDGSGAWDSSPASIALDTFVSVGSPTASTGAFRTAHGANFYGRKHDNSTDVRIFGYGTVGNNSLIIGEGGMDPVYLQAATQVISNIAGTDRLIVLGTNLYVNVPTIRFAAGVSSPLFHQDDVGSGTGQNLIVKAQTTLGSSAAGGHLLLRGGYKGSGGVDGSVKVQVGSSGVTIIEVADGSKLGFHGATPVAQQTRAGQLTDSTTGSADATVQDVGASHNQTILNNNFADLIAKINALETIIHNLGLST